PLPAAGEGGGGRDRRGRRAGVRPLRGAQPGRARGAGGAAPARGLGHRRLRPGGHVCPAGGLKRAAWAPPGYFALPMGANEPQFSIVRSRGDDELSDRWTGAVGLAVAAIALGYCIAIEGEGLHRSTVLALTFSLVAAMVATSIGAVWSVERRGDRPT